LEEWPVAPRFFEFQQDTEIAFQVGSHLRALKQNGESATLKDTWLIPTKINQGCYDALCLVWDGVTKSYILRVVQLTVASTHGLKLSFVCDILDVLRNTMQLPITGMDVAFVVPKSVYSTFTQGQITGADDARLNDIDRYPKFKWAPSQIRTLLVQRATEL